MKKFTNYISGKRNLLERKRSDELPAPEGDSPEANIVRGLKLFCEAASSENPQGQGEEVLHLPIIVEAAESSPAAAALAAQHIRKYISMNNSSRPHTQYNAIMLIRILSDNPGPTFTRNVDEKFVSTVKGLLRNSKDPSVQQMMRETLTSLYRDKAYDTYLAELFAMWSKESGQRPPDPSRQHSQQSGQMAGTYPPPPPLISHQSSRSRVKQLPPPDELAARIEEAKTSAKLLQQLVQSTPQNELKGNELITEFAERCQSAQRSIQGYINADNPAADDETMQTLIETSEQLSLSLSKHSRALLQARRAAGAAGGTSPTPPPHSASPPLPSLPVRQGLGLHAAAEQQNANHQGGQGQLPPQGPYTQPPQNQYGQPVQGTTYEQSNVSPLQHHPVGGFGGYSPPPLAPSTSVSRKAAPVPESIAPVPVPPAGQTYSPPPMPPPSQTIPPNGPHNPASRPPIPAGIVASQNDEDPFSDRNASPEDTATALPSTSGLPHSGKLDRPGYSQVTSSYVRRQDSSEAHYTMHGAIDSPPSSPPRQSETSRFYAGAQPGEVSPLAPKHTDQSGQR